MAEHCSTFIPQSPLKYSASSCLSVRGELVIGQGQTEKAGALGFSGSFHQ